jgi:hypothetical protein
MAKITISTDALKPRKEWKRHKITAGDNIHRILPPWGDLETHKNVPFKKWSVIWGLTDPESGRMRPINSPSNSEERKCPVYDYLDLLTKKVELLKEQLKAQGLTEDQIKERLAGVNKVLWEIKPKATYAYNAVDQSGAVGILEIKTTAHKAMKKRMMEYINVYSQDPTTLSSEVDDGGIWFNITREGERKETKYDVIFHQTREKDAQGRLVSIDDRSPLPKNVVENYEELGYDLHTLYKTPTYDELKQVLILNLNQMAQDNPHLLIAGFTMADLNAAPVAQQVAPVAQQAAPVAQQAAPVAQQAAIPQGKKPVAISMGEPDEDAPVASAITDSIVNPVVQPAQAVAAPVAQAVSAPSAQMTDEEFMNMANGLLNN